CGDCGIQSNCVAIVPRETEFGRKRAIDQSLCNKDFSCLKGFCPSFVTVENDRPLPSKPVTASPAERIAALPVPASINPDLTYGIVVAGVGGTGLVTLGAIIGRAAHFEGRSVSALDITGLARKGGEVTTHIRIGAKTSNLAARMPDGAADLLIAGDLACAAGPGGISKLKPEGHAVLLDDAVPMVAQAFDPSAPLPVDAYRERIAASLPGGHLHFLDANRIAEKALGETIFGNMVLLGAAAQDGLLPFDIAAIYAAIAAQGVAAEKNRFAFDWGRLSAADPEAVTEILSLSNTEAENPIELFAAELTAYQNAAYADRYRRLVEKAAAAETVVAGAPGRFSETVARTAYRLMAYKDEYEVARLLSDPAFIDPLRDRTGGRTRLTFHLAPPFIPVTLTADGRRGKRRFGGWLLPGLRFMARLKGLRGTPFDIFGRQQERRTERRLIDGYEALIGELSTVLAAANLEAATELAAAPAAIRGFGHIKTRMLANAATAFAKRRAKFLEITGPEELEVGGDLWRALSPYLSSGTD
ncbi:MAG: 2-oxoacid:acceptor oxidoreductase family protein, partial [Hyphomicrobiales bacterium]|nr:2-oxoacid:acceptor oxidoreductase family protein [Hyphomicrobiales bacterium]